MKLMLTVNKRLDEQRRTVAYLDSFPLSRGLRQARLAPPTGMVSLREPHKGVILQSATGEELSALSSSPNVASGIPSVLDRAFKGEL